MMTMKYCCIKILLLAILISTTITGQNFNSTITPDYFRQNGAVRLSDVYQLLPEWQSYSLDSFRWNISSNKSVPDQSQSWDLMMDGQRIDLNFMNMKNVNLLPIAFAQIYEIESSTTPQMKNGAFTDRGFVEFHTNRPKQGFSFDAFISAGNEIGDPGPYKYTKYNSVNIDVIGPDFTTTFAYGSTSFDASLTYKNNKFIYPTPDKYIGSRLSDYKLRYRQIYNEGISLIANSYKLPTKPKLIVLYSCSGKYNFFSPEGTDLLYFAPSAKEIPVNTRFIHVGVNGSEKTGSNGEIKYTAKTSFTEMNVPYEIDSLSTDWQMTNYLFTTGYYHEGGKLGYSFGGGIDLNLLETNYELSDKTNHHYNVNGKISYSSMQRLTHSLELFCEYDGKRVAVKSNLTNELMIDENNSLQMTIAYIQSNVSENNDIWYWLNRSYDLSSDASYAFDIANHIGKNYQFNTALEWMHTFSANTSLSMEVFYNRFTNITLEDYSLARDTDGLVYTTLSSLKSHIDGSSGGAALTFRQRLSKRLDHSLQYNYLDFICGDDLFKETYEVFPEHKLQYRAAYTYPGDLSIAMTLSYISTSKWYSYKSIDTGSQDDINYKIDSRLLCDLALRKWFAHNKLRTSFILKNIFNQKNYYAPNGAFSDLSLYFVAELGI